MPEPKHHEDLAVWNHAIEPAVAAHHVIKALLQDERIAFGGQVRRSAVSIAANLAERAARLHRREFTRLNLVKAKELATISELLDHVGRMPTSLIRSPGTRPD